MCAIVHINQSNGDISPKTTKVNLMAALQEDSGIITVILGTMNVCKNLRQSVLIYFTLEQSGGLTDLRTKQS